MTATTASAWSAKPAAIITKPPTVTAKPSTSYATTPTPMIPHSRPSSKSSSIGSNQRRTPPPTELAAPTSASACRVLRGVKACGGSSGRRSGARWRDTTTRSKQSGQSNSPGFRGSVLDAETHTNNFNGLRLSKDTTETRWTGAGKETSNSHGSRVLPFRYPLVAGRSAGRG